MSKLLKFTLLSCLFFGLFTLASNAKETGHEIKIKVNGWKDSTCFLAYHYADKIYISDTAKLDHNGNATFKGSKTLVGGIYKVFSHDKKSYFDIIVNEQKFSIETDTSNLVDKMKVSGSIENKLNNELQRYMIKQQIKSHELSTLLKQLKNKPDSTKLLNKQLADINADVKKYQTNFIKNNQGTLIAKIIGMMQETDVPESPKGKDGKELDSTFSYKYYKAHFFDNVDFSDQRMLRTPIFDGKVLYYLDNLTVPTPDSIMKAAEYIIEKSRADSNIFRFAVVTLTTKYETSKYMGMDAVFVDLAEKYYLSGAAWWADTSLTNKIEKRVNEIRPTILGLPAKNIFLYDTLNQVIPLYSIRSKFTVLFFYDPDCGHCKKQTPQVKEVYDRIKHLGVEVYGVCTQTNVEKWKNFIKEYNLTWINVADPNYQSNFRNYYDVRSTPVIFILDENKKIIAKKIDALQIEEIISHKLGIKYERPPAKVEDEKEKKE